MGQWTDADPDEVVLEQALAAPLGALRARRQDCPDPAIWPALDAGILPDDVAAAASTHLGRCAVCRILARDLASDDLVSAADSNPVQPPATPPAARRATRRPLPFRAWWWQPLPVAATVVVAVAAVSVWWMTNGRPAPAAPAVARPSGPPAGAGPVYRLSLEKPPVTLPLGSALVWRSDAEGAQRRALAELADALAPYRTDDFAEAALRLEMLVRRRPSAEAWFYLGVCRLFVGHPDAAAADLRRARELAEPPLRQNASWYLAVALERAGAVGVAVSELRGLCGESGEHQARACEAVTLLSSGR